MQMIFGVMIFGVMIFGVMIFGVYDTTYGQGFALKSLVFLILFNH